MGHHEAGRAIFRNAISLSSLLEGGDGTDDVDLYPFVMRVDRREEVGCAGWCAGSGTWREPGGRAA